MKSNIFPFRVAHAAACVVRIYLSSNKIVKRFLALFILGFIPALLSAADLRIVVFSVGSGDSQLIVFPTNKIMLIDTGPQSRTLDTVIPFMQRHGITHLDYFIRSHGHQDHEGGVPDLEAAGFIDASTVRWDEKTFSYEDEFTIEGTDWFVYNMRDNDLNGTTDANTNSLSCLINYNGFEYSYASDEYLPSMNRLMADHPNRVEAHVRNTAHHGWGPFSRDFLLQTNAYLYMVSCSTAVKSENSYKNTFLGAMSTLQGNGGRTNEHALTGDVGNIYIRVTDGNDWDRTFYSASKTHMIPDFYTPPQNDAKFISQTPLPETLMPGESTTVSITLENTGPDTWRTSDGHALGSQNPQGNTNWTPTNRVALPHDVITGQQVTFTFDITAPSTMGLYNFQWQMVDDIQPNQEWFGPNTPNAAINVTWPIINQIQNGSFESGGANPDSWNTPAAVTRSSEDFYDGSFSLKGSGTGSLGASSQLVGLTPNTDYNISVRIHFVSGTGNLVFDTQDKFDTTAQFVLNSPNGGWTKYSGSFNSGAETSVNIRVFTNATFSGTFYVDDIKLEDPTQVTIPNLPPQFTSAPSEYVDAGSSYSYTALTSDPDSDPVTLSGVSVPGWLSFNAASGLLSGTPSVGDIGSHNVSLRASDGISADTDLNFTINVSAAGNDAPLITSIPNTGVIENVAYYYTLTADDADGDTMNYTGTYPAWLSLDANTGELSGTPSATNVGTHDVSLSVSDGTVSIGQDFKIVVFTTPLPSNLLQNGSFENGGATPTSWAVGNASSGTDTTAAEGTSRSLQVNAGSSSTSQAVGLQPNTDYEISAWINTSGLTAGIIVVDTQDKFDGPGQGQFTANASQASDWTKFSGTFNSGAEVEVNIRIFPGGGATPMAGTAYVDHIVLAEVGAGNLAPVITSVPEDNVNPGEYYSYQMSAADAEGDSLQFNAISIPSWLSFDANVGLLSGTPSLSDVGPHSISLSVSDGQETVAENFTITVNPPPNSPPTWTSSPVNKPDATEGVSFVQTVAVNATDPDGDLLTFTKTGGAAWLSVALSGTLSGTPGAGDVGLNSITVQVSDGVNPAVSETVYLTVLAAPDPYEEWKLLNGVSTDAGDDDGDGISNLMEFALSGDPKSASSGQKPELSNNGSDVEFKFRRGEASVTYTIEKSTDLSNWTDHMTVTDIHGTVGSDATVTVSGAEMSSGKLFLRLRVDN